MNIQDALSQYKNEIVGGLAGAAIGGGAVGFGTSKREAETDQEFKNRRLQNALIGALSGGALGTGGAAISESLPSSTAPRSGILSKIKTFVGNTVNPFTNVPAGLIASTGAGAGLGRIWDNVSHAAKEQAHWANPQALANFRREANAVKGIAKFPRMYSGGAIGAALGLGIPAALNHALPKE